MNSEHNGDMGLLIAEPEDATSVSQCLVIGKHVLRVLCRYARRSGDILLLAVVT